MSPVAYMNAKTYSSHGNSIGTHRRQRSARRQTCICLYIHIYRCICIYIHTHVCEYICTYINTHVYVYLFMHTLKHSGFHRSQRAARCQPRRCVAKPILERPPRIWYTCMYINKYIRKYVCVSTYVVYTHHTHTLDVDSGLGDRESHERECWGGLSKEWANKRH